MSALTIYLLLTVVPLACARTTAAPNAPEAFPVVPLQVLIVRANRSAAVVVSLERDGTLRDAGGVIGKLEGGRIVAKGGEERLAVDVEGGVSHGGRRAPLRFTSGDDVVADNGRRIGIDDTGHVVFTPPMRKNRAFSFKIDGFQPAMRKTALLVFLLVVLEHDHLDEP